MSKRPFGFLNRFEASEESGLLFEFFNLAEEPKLPLGFPERVGQLGKRGGFLQRGDCAGKAQEIFSESVFDCFEEEPPEQP